MDPNENRMHEFLMEYLQGVPTEAHRDRRPKRDPSGFFTRGDLMFDLGDQVIDDEHAENE